MTESLETDNGPTIRDVVGGLPDLVIALTGSERSLGKAMEEHRQLMARFNSFADVLKAGNVLAAYTWRYNRPLEIWQAGADGPVLVESDRTERREFMGQALRWDPEAAQVMLYDRLDINDPDAKWIVLGTYKYEAGDSDMGSWTVDRYYFDVRAVEEPAARAI